MDIYRNYRIFHDLFVLFDEKDHLRLRTFNLTPMQYQALLLLDPQEGWRLTDLSDWLLCERSTVTRLVDFLEGKGLLTRIADADDRRSQRVTLTSAGALLRDRARVAHEASLWQRFSGLSEEEKQQLFLLHQKLLSHLLTEKERSNEG